MGGGRLLDRLQRRRLARPLRGELVRRRRHARVGKERRPAARSALFRNDHGRFVDVSKSSHAGIRVKGTGCAAADLNGDGYPDLVVTTATGVEILWNDRNGTFTARALAAPYGWYSAASVADVNGDGRPDVFVAGYTNMAGQIPGSIAGFPTNHEGVRDLLYLNEGDGTFKEVGVAGGSRVVALPSRPRRDLHRRERRRPSGSVRRERRGSERPLDQPAGRAARIPLRRRGEVVRRRRPERRDGRRRRRLQRRRPPGLLRHELSRPAPRRATRA